MRSVYAFLAAALFAVVLTVATPAPAVAQYYHCDTSDYYELLNILNGGPQYDYQTYDSFYSIMGATCSFSQVMDLHNWIGAYSTGSGFEETWDLTWQYLAFEAGGA
jgi:hypothetical protein